MKVSCKPFYQSLSMSTAVLGLTCWKIGLSPIRFRFGVVVILLERMPTHCFIFIHSVAFSLVMCSFFLLLRHKFPYTDTTLFRIRPPCLNFAVYVIHVCSCMLPRRFPMRSWLDIDIHSILDTLRTWFMLRKYIWNTAKVSVIQRCPYFRGVL